jgi:hypothetical protein
MSRSDSFLGTPVKIAPIDFSSFFAKTSISAAVRRDDLPSLSTPSALGVVGSAKFFLHIFLAYK